MTVQALLVAAEERHGIRAEDGLQILSAAAVATRPFDPGLPVLIIAERASGQAAVRDATDGETAPTFQPPVLPGRHASGADAVAMLLALYPPTHPVLPLVGEDATTVGALHSDVVSAGGWLLPALVGERNAASPHGLPFLVARLRAPDGCPWDQEQDHRTLKKFLLEEAYEVYDALEDGATPALAEELGDLLLQIVLHAQYAAEAGVFDLRDVYREVVTKIVRRHPHVFGDVVAEDSAQVIRNWEQIKAGERAARPAKQKRPGPAAFAGLSPALPALLHAQEMQERAAGLGYDWPDVEGVIEKLGEEAVELLNAETDAERRDEFGDLLFVIVNLGRKLGLDAEASLRAASQKFSSRFARVERQAEERGVTLQRLPFEVLDEMWDNAKAEEREEAQAASRADAVQEVSP